MDPQRPSAAASPAGSVRPPFPPALCWGGKALLPRQYVSRPRWPESVHPGAQDILNQRWRLNQPYKQEIGRMGDTTHCIRRLFVYSRKFSVAVFVYHGEPAKPALFNNSHDVTSCKQQIRCFNELRPVDTTNSLYIISDMMSIVQCFCVQVLVLLAIKQNL